MKPFLKSKASQDQRSSTVTPHLTDSTSAQLRPSLAFQARPDTDPSPVPVAHTQVPVKNSLSTTSCPPPTQPPGTDTEASCTAFVTETLDEQHTSECETEAAGPLFIRTTAQIPPLTPDTGAPGGSTSLRRTAQMGRSPSKGKATALLPPITRGQGLRLTDTVLSTQHFTWSR